MASGVFGSKTGDCSPLRAQRGTAAAEERNTFFTTEDTEITEVLKIRFRILRVLRELRGEMDFSHGFAELGSLEGKICATRENFQL